MIPIGMMRTRLDVVRYTQTRDALGQATTTSTVVHSCVGRIETATYTDEQIHAGASALGTLQAVMPWLDGIKVGDALQVYTYGTGSTVYQITSVTDDDLRRRWLRLGLVVAQEAIA